MLIPNEEQLDRITARLRYAYSVLFNAESETLYTNEEEKQRCFDSTLLNQAAFFAREIMVITEEMLTAAAEETDEKNDAKKIIKLLKTQQEK